MGVFVVAPNARSVASMNKRVESGAGNLMLFHADWCGHCQALKPEWERLKGFVANFALAINELEDRTLAFISEKMLAPYCNIAGYPTIVLFKDNNRFQYAGMRTAEAIRDWLLSLGVPPSPVRASSAKPPAKRARK